MFVAIHSRSLSLPVALAACARMAGLNLKKRLPD
ncbi:histidine kinase [Burkholderia oklahomensis EO147]|nr:histidine kinase [Burkholderia oklahomensis EO147]AOI47333.1 histidine kinase [Burkholderia oklahomensis C6786]MBI0359959.1 histidine kinase [Burkholderia oklahomensis]KUY49388.1 histidine kinase [Burkholderia oklahomensis EO147]KUY63446.1 histidine kinase [Burkholderia oklahomensis C6786]